MTPRTRTGACSRAGNRRRAAGLAPLLAAGLAVAAAGLAATAPAAATPRDAGAASARAQVLRPACPAAPFKQERCLVLYAPQTSVNAAIAGGVSGAAARPKGWGARQLEHAYKLPVGRSSRATVAVSIAFDTPHLARYLAVYRKQFGLPRAPRGAVASARSTRRARPGPSRHPACAPAGTSR